MTDALFVLVDDAVSREARGRKLSRQAHLALDHLAEACGEYKHGRGTIPANRPRAVARFTDRSSAAAKASNDCAVAKLRAKLKRHKRAGSPAADAD